MKRPVRYRDVLAMLKEMARDERLSSEAIRGVLAGNIGEPSSTAYTQADIEQTKRLAAELGWELTTTLEPASPDAPIDAVPKLQEEVRRLHAALRVAREQVKAFERATEIARTKSTQRHEARRAQMEAAAVVSIDHAFARLARAEDALGRIAAGGIHGAAWCAAVASEVLLRRSESASSVSAVDDVG